MNEILYACGAMFLYIFARAFQQRNVAFDTYIAVIPTSWLMFACEAYVIATVASRGWDFYFVIAVGTSAGVGALLAILAHKRVFGGES